jgi:hypothetical protein
MRTRFTMAAALLALLGFAALPLAEGGPIQRREVRQQKRIGHGVRSGELTRERNRASRHIIRQKHDAQQPPGAK